MAFIQNDYEKAAKYYLYIISKNLDDANSLYNLSCCYARLKLPELAGYFLIMSVNAGYNNFKKIKTEEAYKPILDNQYFRDVLNQYLHMGKILVNRFI